MVEHPLQSVIRRLRGLIGGAAPDACSDGQLLQRFLTERDESAFATLLERHGPMVRGACRHLLADPADQDDAFQATFLLLVRKAASVRKVESLAPWLHQVACRAALTARRSAARRRTHESQVPAMNPSDPVADAARNDWAPVLHEEVDRLPEKYRQPVVLCYFEGKTTAEAAELLHWPVGTVKVRLMRAREVLQQRLVRRGLALTPALAATIFTPGAASAAVPPALFQSTLQAAAQLAAGAAPAAVAPAVVTLVEGVAHAMFLNKLKMIAAAVLVIGVLGSGTTWLATRPTASAVPVPPAADKVKPGQIAVGKPDKNGLITMFRPVVTRLAPGDPVKVALHWSTEKGHIPADFENKTIFSSLSPRDATLNSMTFTITGPDGKAAKLKTKVAANLPGYKGQALFYQPTFLLTLSPEGVQENEGMNLKGAWVDNQKAKLDAAGVYTLQISGSIVLEKGDPIPFETGNIQVEIGTTGIKTLAQAEAAAREALEKKGHKLNPGAYGPAENPEGQRVFKFTGPVVAPPPDPNAPIIAGAAPFMEFIVPVTPEGKVGTIAEQKKLGCIARGTRIDTANGQRAIEQVGVGDRIWGFDLAARKRVLTTVQVVQRNVADQTYVFGGTLRATAPHPIFANGEWKQAADIAEKDTLHTADGRAVRAGTPKVVYGSIDVFDLSVDGPHTFFAGGFLVHNKSVAFSPLLTDPWHKLWPSVAK